jgi:hypothetical protein
MAARSPPAKATLFCPDCPHRSHVDGDWLRVECEDGVRLYCPNCEAVLVTQPETPTIPVAWSP